MKRRIVCIVTLLALAGCQWEPLGQSKSDAYDRWYKARAKVLYGAGREHLKVGQLDKAAKKAREALALAPEYTDARILLGKVLIEQGLYSQGIDQLEQAAEKQPESAEVQYLLAVGREKAGDLPRALALYRRSYALDDTSVSPIVAAGEVLVQMGRTDDARELIRPHLSAGEDEPALYELAGRLAMMQEDYAAAADYFQHAHDLDYRNCRYRESLAQAQVLSGEHSRAVDTLEDLLATEDYEPPAWVYTMLGDCRMKLGRHVGARDAFEQASRRRPSDPKCWTNLARAALALDDVPRAVLWAGKAVKIDASCVDATLLLGYALLADGQAHRAVRTLAENRDRFADNPMLFCLMGRAYAATGETTEAQRCYRQALQLDPDHPLATRLAAGGNGPVTLD
jgi:tetratricopeptide (TPR) repeat protein